MTDGFPELTDSFLFGQDIFYEQFNDVEFYVEDKDQEHLYFNILRKLFPGLKFEKIFPLNGKKNVKDDSLLNIGNKKKVYIVDLDFDHILNKVESRENLFYLKKYSIENYLVSKNAIYEIIRIKNPILKDHEIDNLVDFDNLMKETTFCLKALALAFIVIQKYELGEPYYGLNTIRDFDFSQPNPVYRMDLIPNYLNRVEVKLKTINPTLSLNSQFQLFEPNFKNISTSLSNTPGKYILTFIKDRLQSLRLINQVGIDSFTYLLSKDHYNSELDFLKMKISQYIN